MKTTYRFDIPAEVFVTVEGSDADEATFEEAVRRVTSALDTFSTGLQSNGVRLYGSIDGMDPSNVEEAP